MDETFTVAEMRLAFAYHLMQLVVSADGHLDAKELAFVEGIFPEDVLEKARFLDDEGEFTARYEAAKGEALLELPGQLDEAGKLGLVDLLIDASLADDHLEAREVQRIVHAGRLLDLTEDDVMTHLGRRGTLPG